ncbi:LamG-like jellyroll fold domain-containing protein [Ferriphaselus sp. R-1]|uniref:LamG-like jellyroll fold domain-containing protein n=1 Tax=Ferriphaselus sp. R-1 TaxID=1485544 RepID=UPI0005525560|nr:LamG-like jellyroll fold domain-containing protein [Ferriphaselus sp. R-1]
MSIPTVPVSILLHDQSGLPMAGVRITAMLNRNELYNGVVVPKEAAVTTDASGGAVLNLFPNQLGTQQSQYVIKIQHGGKSNQYTATVPNAPCELKNIIDMPAYPGKPDGQLAIDAAIAAAGQAGVYATASGSSASAAHTSELNSATYEAGALSHKNAAALSEGNAHTSELAAATHEAEALAHKNAAAADRVATAADKVATDTDRTQTAADRAQVALDAAATAGNATATAADRTQTGLDRTATGADRTAVAADKATVALNKTSVDGTAVAVSANAATATTKANESVSARDQAIAAKDQALAAWVSAMQPAETLPAISKTFHTSTTIVQQIVYDARQDSDGGQWRKRCQNTSWYKETINSKWLGEAATAAAAWGLTGAVTGAYFHNTTDGKFYTLGAASPTVAETFLGNRREFPESGIALIDTITGVARVCVYDTTDPTVPMWRVFSYAGKTITSVAYRNGWLIVGTSTGLFVEKLISDDVGLAEKYTTATTPAIISNTINSVAMTVVADAPIDIATGLPVPTIAVATAGGVSVIRHDGVVVNSASIAVSNAIRIDKLRRVCVQNYGSEWYMSAAMPLSASFALTGTFYANRFQPVGYSISAAQEGALATANGGVLKYVPSDSQSNGLAARITNTYNSGWQVGDSRGAWLADSVAETVSAPELVVNGTFNTDVSGWSVPASGNGSSGTVSWGAAGGLTITRDAVVGNVYVAAQQIVSVVVGKTYIFKIARTSAPLAGAAAHLGNFQGDSSLGANIGLNVSQGVQQSYTFIATSSSLYITVFCGFATPNVSATFDNISVKEVAADRSVKNNGLGIVGSLTKSAVATGAQLMAWSGFSAANYLEQPYSANLDFGTGDFCFPMWVYATAANQTATLFTRCPVALSGNALALNLVAGLLQLGRSIAGAAFTNTTFGYTLPVNAWTLVNLARVSGVISLRINGVQQATTIADTNNYTNASAVFTAGTDYTHAAPFTGSMALVRSSATPASAEQGLFRYETERKLFEPNAQCLIDGTSTGVTALAADDVTDLIHVGTSWGRSTFKNLIRVESEATTNGAAKSYSVYDKQLIQAGATGSKITVPAKSIRDELNRAAEQAAILGLKPQPVDFTATAGQTAFKLPLGMKPLNEVMKNGTSLRLTTSYTTSFDGFCWSINLVAAAALNDWVQVMCVRENKQ